MQLTLRTLLAYRDDCLEPLETARLGRRIEQTPNAHHLDRRVDAVLASDLPPATDLDPNTVAEYLDNELPDNVVAAFERDCLHSDANLSEVAACHKILSLVLTQPAEIPEHIRRRAFVTVWDAVDGHTREVGVPWLASETRPTTASETKEESEESIEVNVADEPTVVEATVAKAVPRRSRWKTPLILVATLIGGTLVAAVLLSQGSWRLWSDENPQTAAAQRTGDDHPVVRPSPKQPTKDKTALKQQLRHPTPKTMPATIDAAVVARSDKSTANNHQVAKAVPNKPLAAADQTPAVGSVNISTAKAKAPDEKRSSQRPDTEKLAAGNPTAPASKPVPNTANGVAVPLPPLSRPQVVAPHLPVAKLTEPDFLVVRFDHNQGIWRRLAARGDLLSGEPFVSFRGQNSEFQFDRGMVVTAVGATRGTPLPPDAANLSGLSVRYGRLLLTGKRNAQLRLAVGAGEVKILLRQARTTVAVEFRNYAPPGSDPHGQDSSAVVQVFVISGSIEWTSALARDGKERLAKGKAVSLVTIQVAGQPETSQSYHDMRVIPEWARPARAATWFADVKNRVSARLPLDAPAVAALQSLSQEDSEVAGYARECLIHLGRWKAGLQGLGRESCQLYWNNFMVALRTVIDLDPETAEHVVASMALVYPEDARQLSQLIIGYSNEQLAGGKDAELVEALNHPNLCIRAAAFENLRKITGATLLYRPQASAGRRKSRVANWQQMVKEKKVSYRQPPRQLLHVKIR